MPILTIGGRQVKIFRSNRRGKKLGAKFTYRGRERNVHFGATGAQHYFDKSGTWNQLDHKDAVKRRNWRKRFKNTKRGGRLARNNPLSPLYWSWRILW